MRKRPERAGRISIQTLTISPMINVLNLVAPAGFRPSPRGYKEEPEGAFYKHFSQSSWLREPDFDLRTVVIKRSPRALSIITCHNQVGCGSRI